MRKFRFYSLLLFASGLLFSCGEQKQNTSSGIEFIINHSLLEDKGQESIQADSSTYPLPSGYCYAVHVTGPGQSTLSTDAAVCGPEDGWGRVYGFVENTQNISFSLPRNTYRFALVGTPNQGGCAAAGLTPTSAYSGQDMGVLPVGWKSECATAATPTNKIVALCCSK